MTVPQRARGASGAALLAAVLSLCVPSLARADAPVNLVSPTISGTPRVGQTLTASQGEWQNEPTSFFYQWLRCDAMGGNCSAVAGATDPQYGLTEADLGLRLRVEVVASNADGASPAQRSAASGIVKVPAPTLTAKPRISGAAREGETLTATTGAWTGSPTSFEFQWKRCLNGQCIAIAGAIAQTYLLGAADVGTRVRARVEARNSGGSRAAHSASTPPVQSATAGLRLGPPRKDPKRGLARFRVAVPSAGTLTLARTAKVRGQRRSALGPRDGLKLTVKPRGRARTQLRRRGELRVRIRVVFASAAGPVVERRRMVSLRYG